MAELLNTEGLNEKLLKWDKECVRRMLGKRLPGKTPNFVGPETVMLHVFIEYLCTYILQESAENDARFELQELQRCGNFFEGSPDMPNELKYLVVLKKLRPEVCFFEDVEFGNSGESKIRVTDRDTQKKWKSCLYAGEFLDAYQLAYGFTACVQKFVKVLQLHCYPSQITGLLPSTELPSVTACVWTDCGLKLTIHCPLFRKIWQMDAVTVYLMPSVKFPGWPSSADFPKRIDETHPLYCSYMEAASKGFYVTPVTNTSGSQEGCVWKVDTSSLATRITNTTDVQVTSNSCLRLLMMLTGKLNRCDLIDETLTGLAQSLHSIIPIEMIKNILLYEMENVSEAGAWTPGETARRLLNLLSHLKDIFQGTPSRDYVFPGLLHSPDIRNKTEVVKGLIIIEEELKERIHLDLGQTKEVEIQEDLSKRQLASEQVQKFLHHQNLTDFPVHFTEAWKLLAESNVLAHSVYEREPRINVLMFILQLTEGDQVYDLVMLCELFRQCASRDPVPVKTLQTAIVHTRQCMSHNDVSSILHDLDPFVGEAVWLSAYSNAFSSAAIPHGAIAQQPLPAYAHPPHSQVDSWNAGGGSAYDGTAFDDGPNRTFYYEPDGNCGCCTNCCECCCGDDDCQCCNCDCKCSDCCDCDCGDCNCCGDDCDCVIM